MALTARERLAERTGTATMPQAAGRVSAAASKREVPARTVGRSAALYRLCCQAFDLRDGPYASDAYQAIVEWWDRHAYDDLCEEERKTYEAVRLLRWRPGA